MCNRKNQSFAQFLGVMLASRMVPFMIIIYGLAGIQIRMPFHLIIYLIDAGLPE
jgi:hypothetical protein